MGLKYIYGTDNNELLKVLFKDVQKELNKELDTPVILLTRYKNTLEEDIRKYGIVDKNLRLKILELEDIVKLALRSSKYKYSNSINNISKEFILLKLLREYENLTTYKSLCNSTNITSLFSNTIRQLKEELRQIEDLKVISDNLSDDSSTKLKLLDIYNIAREYEVYKTQNNFIDNEDRLYITSKIIDDLKIIHEASLYIVDFENTTKLEELVFEKILLQAYTTSIVLNTDIIERKATLDSSHFYKIDLFIDRINHICRTHNIQRDSDIYVDSEKNTEITHICKYLYKYPFTSYSSKTNYLTITENNSMYDEVENIAYTIRKIRNEGVDFENINIIAFNFNDYEEIIRNTFDKFNIPFNINSSVNLNSVPVIKFIYCVANLYSRNFMVIDIINYLKYLPELTIGTVCTIENYLNSLNQEQFIVTEGIINNLERNEHNEVIFIIYEELKSVIELFKSLDTSMSIHEKCVLLYNGISSIYFNGRIHEENLETELHKYDIEGWNNFVNVISIISNIFEETSTNTLDFLELVINKLNNSMILDEQKDIGRVSITTNKTSIRKSDYIFVLNANEGILNFNEEIDTLINPIDKKLLKNYGVELFSSDEQLRMVEQYSMYKLLTLANIRLSISIPLTDRAESKLKKAPIILRLKQLFPYCSSDNYNVFNTEGYDLSILPKDAIIPLVARTINKGYLEDELVELDYIKSFKSYNDEITLLEQALQFNNNSTPVDTYKISELYFSDTFSVSKLEKYNKCPFSYFIEYGLNIKEKERLIPDFRHTGIFIHEIIEKFSVRLVLNNLKWSEVDLEYIKKEVDEISNNILNSTKEHILLTTPQHRKHITRLKDITISSIEAITRHLGKSFFEVLGNEITFGDRATYPSILIRLDNGKRVKLRGQIDRADYYQINDTKYVRIVDYKTGENKFSYSDILNGLQLQLITYLDAILTASKDKEYTYKPAGVFYLKLDKPFVKCTPQESDLYIKDTQLKELRMDGTFLNENNLPKYMDTDVYDGLVKNSLNINARFKNDGTLMKATPGLTTAEFEDLITYTKIVIKETISKMLSGDISIYPISKKKSTTCNYCNYRLICMFDETLRGNQYRYIPQYKSRDALESIRKKVNSSNE